MSREIKFVDWLNQQCDQLSVDLKPLQKDASFRRYFRLNHDDQWLAVDAPPEHEKNEEFIQVAQAFSQMGIRVPNIKAYDIEHGFLLVENLGLDSYLAVLQQHPERADTLYKQAIDKLIDITMAHEKTALMLPAFDKDYMQGELNHFTEWFLENYLQCSLSKKEKTLLQQAYDFLIKRAENQQQVCIHRDYHSRNLIVREDDNPGVIDFQDAMLGPVTYDLVSLLRDAYIDWPREQVETWARYFYDEYQKRNPAFNINFETFMDDFNLMGVQRNLKAIFIFARKWLRDQDPGYLNDIPRTLHYVLTIAKEYPELNAFQLFLSEQVQPKLENLK